MDRQDIDALLVGALYGELTPADEARLAAHLEAHPADRGALDDLKSARAKVRESRIFEDAGSSGGLIEPPQHISALLLQEAHRRAPKRAVATDGAERESWFFRFTRVFLAHPAMAAAAMLVLVVGVAGTMYVKKGTNYAERSAPAMNAETTAAPTGGDQTVAAAGSAAAEDSAAFRAGLAEQGDLAEGTASDRWDNEQEKKEADAPAIAEAKPKAAPSRRRAEGIEVTTEQQQPKDYGGAKESAAKVATAPAKALAKGSVAKNDAYRDYDGAADDVGAAPTTTATTTPSTGYGRGVVGGASGGGGASNTGMAQPPPPPPPSGNFAAAPKQDVATDKKAATVAKAPTAPPPAQAAPAPTATPQDSTLVGWAKSTHAQVIAKVKAGDCQGAAKLALTVSNRAPDYYSQYMATDRQLKSCKQYIDSERDKDAEKANKTRAQKRVNADEAAPAPSTK